MKHESRVLNTVKNVGVGSVLQVITMLLSFVSRTVFVQLLGNDYLSCNGLFSNILTILSFSELGIGSAIIYSLYRPIEKNDRVQIGKLLNLFATAYKYIALFILTAGLVVVPFLKYIIKDVPSVKESITLLYVMFLLNTVSSYIWGYKRSYLMACQKNYIVLLVQHGFEFLKIIMQILLLLITRNYILFLLIMIICTLGNNIVSTYITDRKYPWLKAYTNRKLSKEERKPIFDNIKSIIQYKFGSVILNGTDNILISVCLTTAYVGLCSNYNLIINSVTTIVNQACNGMVASIGSYNVSAGREENLQIFKKLYFISFWFFGFVCIAMCTLLAPFVGEIWLGKAYMLDYSVIFAMSLSNYILLIDIIPSSFRTASGLFHETRIYPALAAVMNIILSIFLAKLIGLSGIFFATVITRLVCYVAVDGFWVYKKTFERKPHEFFQLFFENFIVLSVAYSCTYFAVRLVTIQGIIGFGVKVLVCTVVSNTVFYVLLHNRAEYKEVKCLIKRYLRRL